MSLVVDTSVIISVITNEAHKQKLINITKGVELIAPHALHWEIGNAFSAMFKRKRISLANALEAIQYYKMIQLRFCDIELKATLEISDKLNIYAYDAYFIACAKKYNCPLISLDQGLLKAAKNFGIKTQEILQ